MLDKEVISQDQLFVLTLLNIIGTSILIGPPLFVLAAQQNAWIGVLIGILVGFTHILIYKNLTKRYPDQTLIGFIERILGKWLGKGLSLLFFMYFLVFTSGLLRMIGDFITTNILTDTPIEAIEISFLLLIIFGVRLGLEPFSRTAELVVPWVLIFFFLLTFFLLPEIKFENLSPVMESGIKPIIKTAIFALGIPFSDLIILLMLTPQMISPDKIAKPLTFAVIFGGLILLTIVLLSILVLGSGAIDRINYPIYFLAQKVNVGNFIQRIEVLAGAIVFISTFIKTSISFYATIVSFTQILALKNYKIYSFPLGMIMFVLSIVMSPNIIFFNHFILTTWIPLSITFGLLIPLVLWIIDSIKMVILKRKHLKAQGV